MLFESPNFPLMRDEVECFHESTSFLSFVVSSVVAGDNEDSARIHNSGLNPNGLSQAALPYSMIL